jgi:hypothetical protein
MTVAELLPYLDKTVTLKFHDGEVATVKIQFVDAEYGDINIVDIIHTNDAVQYKGQSDSAYPIRASDIVSVDEISS